MQTHKLYGGEVTLEFDERDHVYFVNGEKLDLSVSDITKVLDKPALVGWAAKMCGEFVEKNQARLRDIVVVGTQLSLEDGDPIVMIDEVKLDQFVRDMKQYRYQALSEAAKVGTLAHKWIEDHIKATLGLIKKHPAEPVNEAVKNAVQAFLDWEKKNDVRFIASERLIFSRRGRYPGTLDLDAEVNGIRGLWDVKTGSGIYPEMFYQGAGYKLAAEEEESHIAGKPVAIYKEVGILNFNKTTGKFKVDSHSGARLKRDEKIFKHCLGIRKTQLIDNPKDKERKW